METTGEEGVPQQAPSEPPARRFPPDSPSAAGIPPRRSRRKIAAVALAVVVLVVALSWGFVYWYANLRPVTWREVLERDAWPVGPREFEDIITNVTAIETTDGRAVALDFAPPPGIPPCNMALLADPSATYRIGDRYHTTLRFQPYSYNGAPAVWASEILCPFPLLWFSFGNVLDAVSVVMGLFLVNRGTDSNGWTTYEMLSPNGDRFPASDMPVSLRREPSPPAIEYPHHVGTIDSAADWIVVGAQEYVAISGGYRPDWEVDRMGSLAEGTSVNGTVRFVDSNADGYAGDGDQIRLHLPAVSGEGQYQTYLLNLDGGMAGPVTIVKAVKAIVNRPGGPHEWFPYADTNPWFQLVHRGDAIGPMVTSTIEVGRIPFGTPRPYSEYRFLVRNSTAGYPSPYVLIDGDVQTQTVTRGNLTFTYEDRTADGLLNTGDQFVIAGLTNQSHLEMWTTHGGSRNTALAWIAGYGHVAGPLPRVTFGAGTALPYNVTANVSYRHPELALGKTLAVSLFENSTRVLDHISLADGMAPTWPNGSLSFSDWGGDGFLSTGDAFVVQGGPGAVYRLEVSVLFDSHTWSVDFGP